MHGRGHLINSRIKKINKRLFILKHIWGSYDNYYVSTPGALDKYNLVCSCWMCSYNKTKKIGHKYSEKRKMLRDQDWCNDYYMDSWIDSESYKTCLIWDAYDDYFY